MSRRIVLFMVIAVISFAFTACGGSSESTDAAASVEQQPAEVSNAIPVENAFRYTHVDGHKEEREITAFVLFEYEQLKTVKYQVAYIACTCRGPEVNYWSVAYVEINKDNNTIETISFDKDAGGHYTAGMYGDSEESWDGTPVRELFAQFIDESIMGKTEEEIDATQAMHGSVDAYTGATVTPNNAIRMLQGLFEYHKRNYS